MAQNIRISGSSGTTIAVGDVVADVLDDGGAPMKIGGIARTANPTAVGAGDRVSATYDDVGRQITYPYTVRDLITTARVTLTNGTETNLLAGVASTFNDLLYISGINTSSAAQTVDIRDNLAGGIVFQLNIAGSGREHIDFPVPIPQNEAGNSWTADIGDDTNSNVTLDAIFIRNI